MRLVLLHAADRDDTPPAVLLHIRLAQLYQPQRGFVVGLQLALNLVGCDVNPLLAELYARVQNEDVDVADRVVQLVRAVRTRQVGDRDTERAGKVGCVYALGRRRAFVIALRAVYNHVRAAVSEAFGYRVADSLC